MLTSSSIGRLVRLSVAVGVQLISPATGHTQAGAGDGELTVPSGTLACRGWIADVRDSAAFRYDFMDVSPNGISRKSSFAYDSVGKPLYAAFRLTATSDTLDRLIVIAARLQAHRDGARVSTSLWKTTSRDEPQPDVKQTALESIQLSQIDSLGRWFWERRCKAGQPYRIREQP